jgi:stage II sporulation protein D
MIFRRENLRACSVVLWLVIVAGCSDRQSSNDTPQIEADEQFWIRVLLLEKVGQCSLSVPSTFSIVDWQEEPVHVEATGASIIVEAGTNGIAIGGRFVPGPEVTVLPEQPQVFSLDGSSYRGRLKLIASSEAAIFDAVNLVPLEPYLAGVIGAEMPNYWEPAALRAQAIAARTYCLYTKRRFGVNRSWDVRRSQANQVYLGLAGESAQVWDAVNKTSGQVLTCKQADGRQDIFPAYYSSNCGGHTEDSKHVFGESFESLVGRECGYCRDIAKPAFFFWPAVHLDKSSVTKRLVERYPSLERLGQITGIEPIRQSNYGTFSRLTLIKLLGSTGNSDVLRAEDLRLAIDRTGRKLRSTICRIADVDDKWAFLAGRGYGHGVGMCQCGAQAMARKGNTAQEILLFYYQHSKTGPVSLK